MESKEINFSLPNLQSDDIVQNGGHRQIPMKTMAMSSVNLTTNVSRSDSVSKASTMSTLPRDKHASWVSGFRLQYVDDVIAGAKAGDHVKMTQMVSKLGTEGFAALIREHDGKDNGPLHYAALNNDVPMTKLLLQYGADVNDIGEYGKSPLHFAAMRRATDRVTTMQGSESGDVEALSLIQADGSMSHYLEDAENSDSSSDGSPIRLPKAFMGFLRGKEKKKSHQSELSLKMGDEANITYSSSKSPLPPTAEEKEKPTDEDENDGQEDVVETRNADENTVDILLSAGADPSAKDTKGTTPLHLAFMHSNMDAFKRLLTAPGVDIDAQTRRGTTSLFLACKSGNTDGALILINKGADILISDINGDTPLHVAVRHSHTTIVMALIEVAESTGKISELLLDENSRGVIPLYDAVRCGHKDLFLICLNHVSKRTSPESEVEFDKLINFASRDNDDTLLHLAASAGYLDIIEALLINGAFVNPVNFDRQTPLHLACATNKESIALCLIENGGDVNIADSADLNPLQVAVNNGSFETLMSLLQYISASSGGHSDEATDILEWSAQHNKADILRKILDYEFRFHETTDDGIMDFIMDAVKSKHKETVHVLVRWNRAVVDHRDKLGNTPLHHAAEGGHQDIALDLIQAKAHINATNGVDLGGLSPLHYVAARGWTRTARVLLDSHADIDQRDSQMMTPLHHACKQGHTGMVDLLLFGKGAGNVTQPADVALRDSEGLNCLDHAIDNGHETIATMIITHLRWQEVMSVSSLDEETNYSTTPMRKLIRSMPDVAKVVLDRCITVTGGTSIRDKDVRVEFYYELLEDAFSPWMKSTEDFPTPNGGVLNGFLNRMYRRVSTRLQSDVDDQYEKNDHLSKSAVPFIADGHERNDNHPLELMVSSKRVDLLDHPLVTTFLQNKWSTFGRYIFYTGFGIYITFLAMLTGYIIVIPPNYYIRSVNHTEGVDSVLWYADGQHRWVESVPSEVLICFDVFGPTTILILSVLNLFREFAQMFVQRLSYFRDGGNIMELFLYTAAILFSLPFSEVQYVENGSIKQPWQWPIGAAAGFLGWINLLLFIRGNSKLGIYVIMFIDIFKTFLRFSLILFLFVMAFGLAFYALLMNQNPFHSLFDSLMKTFVMMIGELDYANIFFGQDYLGTSNTLEADGEKAFFMNASFNGMITQLFFVLFLIVMSILMMNMLVGLAVDDIQAIQEKANLHRLTMQADMVLENQSKFPLWMWRRSVVRKKTFLLNEIKLKKWLRQLTGGRKQLKRALQISNDTENPLTIESPNEEAYEKIRGRMKDVSWKVEQATIEMLAESKKRDTQLNQIQGAQASLYDRTDRLQSTQERLGDRMEMMHRKLDVMLEKLKVKQKKGEGFF